jgi:hypothetical protein
MNEVQTVRISREQPDGGDQPGRKWQIFDGERNAEYAARDEKRGCQIIWVKRPGERASKEASEPIASHYTANERSVRVRETSDTLMQKKEATAEHPYETETLASPSKRVPNNDGS